VCAQQPAAGGVFSEMAAHHTPGDLEEAQRLVETATMCLEEQRNRLVWLAASGQDTEQAEQLLEVMLQIARQLLARRDLIDGLVRASRNGAA
jgi:hypothetical protein